MKEPLDGLKSHYIENWFVYTYMAKKELKFFMGDRKFGCYGHKIT